MLARLSAAGQIAVERDKVRLAGHRPTLSAAEETVKKGIEDAYRTAGLQPPPPDSVLGGLAVDRKAGQAVFRRLVDDGLLVKVSADLYLHRESHQAMRNRIVEHLQSHPTINVGVMKELFGLSRKYAIPYLEHLDAIRVTRRQGDERVPY
jgi:selenocysteine-specific elongation factor